MASRGSNAPVPQRDKVENQETDAKVDEPFELWKTGLKEYFLGTQANNIKCGMRDYKMGNVECSLYPLYGDWVFELHFGVGNRPAVNKIWNFVQKGIQDIELGTYTKRLVNLVNNYVDNRSPINSFPGPFQNEKQFLWAIEKDNATTVVVIARVHDAGVYVCADIIYDKGSVGGYSDQYWRLFAHYSANVPELKNFHATAVKKLNFLHDQKVRNALQRQVHSGNQVSCAKCGKQILSC
jgi:hypothetical protein